MLRVFGEPKSKKTKFTPETAVLTVAQLLTIGEMYKNDTERLKVDLTTAQDELRAARYDAGRERDRLLDLLAAQQRLLEGKIGSAVLIPSYQL